MKIREIKFVAFEMLNFVYFPIMVKREKLEDISNNGRKKNCVFIII